MKKVLSLLLALCLIFTLVACTTEVPVPYEVIVKEYVEVEVIKEVEVEVEVETIIYEETKYIEVKIVEYVPREMTEAELEVMRITIRTELKKVFDSDLLIAIENIEPVEVERIVKEPISNQVYEHWYTECIVTRPDKEPWTINNVSIKYTTAGQITGAYNITLDKKDDTGASYFEGYTNDKNPYICTYNSKDNGFINN
jgi:Holliday junction resolvasome RuvABC ATP-dependent DNA helicase subunit